MFVEPRGNGVGRNSKELEKYPYEVSGEMFRFSSLRKCGLWLDTES